MTTLDLSSTQRDVQALAREFAQNEVAPHAAQWNREGQVPLATLRAMAEIGLMGLTIPEEYGGAGLGNLAQALVMEELARADAGLSVAFAVQTGLACGPIVRAGSAAQKEEWLPKLVSAEVFGAYALTEPESGSDTAALTTQAVQADDGSFAISGAKTWISNGGFADLFVVFARTDGPGAHGVSAFLAQPGDGFTVGRELEKMGLHSSSTVELAFDGLKVGGDALLGDRGEGLKLAFRTLDAGRITVAAQACGIAQAALDLASTYASQRQAFGGPIGRFQGVQFPMADVAAKLHAARLATHHAARCHDAGQPHGVEGAMAKLVASAVAVEAADMAVQTLGGYGYSAEYPAERLYRDAKITEIYEGTSQIQRLVIARALLGDAAR